MDRKVEEEQRECWWCESYRDEDQGWKRRRLGNLCQVVLNRMRLVVLVGVCFTRGPESVSMTITCVKVLSERIGVIPRRAGRTMVVERQVQRHEQLLKKETHAREGSREHPE